MSHRATVLMATLLMVASIVPLFAHHSLASEYDPTQATTITGIMSKVQWVNPHVWISMDVKDAKGVVATWRVETAPVGALTKAGLDKSMFALMTRTYPMAIWPAYDGSKHASGRTLTFDDGRTFDVSDKFPQSPVSK